MYLTILSLSWFRFMQYGICVLASPVKESSLSLFPLRFQVLKKVPLSTLLLLQFTETLNLRLLSL